MAFTITPTLGPDIEQFDTDFYWDLTGLDSPQLGAAKIGSDGHKYVYVSTASTLATAGTDLLINETTWAATAGAGTYETPVAAIPAGSRFWARQIAL